MTQKLRQESNFHEAMNLTVMAAGELFGANSREQKAAREAWAEVGM
jgi:Zn-dependent metalloprotease